MITRVKGAAFSTQDNIGYISLGDTPGAKGDGVVDNTSALTTALASGLPVYIPPGTWLISPIVVPVNSTIFGAGTKSILRLKSAVVGSMLTLGSGTSVHLLTIDGNKAGQASALNHGIAVVNAVDVKLGQLSIINTIGDGVNISGGSTVGTKIIDCNFTGFMKTGITVENGVLAYISGCHTDISDVLAIPGDGIALAPTIGGALIYGTIIQGCTSRNLAGRGIAVIGFGSKNVLDTTISGFATTVAGSHGIHLLNTQRVLIAGTSIRSCTGDGFRIEGDVVYCRISECVAYSNTGTSFREVVAGATPNNNGFIYNVSNNNGSDTVVKVGAQSFIV